MFEEFPRLAGHYLATAQAGQGNSLKIIRKTSLHDGMGKSVEFSTFCLSETTCSLHGEERPTIPHFNQDIQAFHTNSITQIC